MADSVRSFGASRRGKEPPVDEFPNQVVLPAMVLKPVELPVVLTVDRDMLAECVKVVHDAFAAAAAAGIAQAIAEIEAEHGVPVPVPEPDRGDAAGSEAGSEAGDN